MINPTRGWAEELKRVAVEQPGVFDAPVVSPTMSMLQSMLRRLLLVLRFATGMKVSSFLVRLAASDLISLSLSLSLFLSEDHGSPVPVRRRPGGRGGGARGSWGPHPQGERDLRFGDHRLWRERWHGGTGRSPLLVPVPGGGRGLPVSLRVRVLQVGCWKMARVRGPALTTFL